MFSQVIGLKQVCCFLEQAVEKKKLSSAYLFVGPDGRGKSFLASNLAKTALCEQETACKTCPSCQLFEAKSHPDFLVIKARNNFIQLDQIQELKHKIYLFPAVSKKRLILIKNVEKMNLESSNAFLKILEEPPKNNYFVLTTANEKIVLQTIRSRCHKIYFPTFSDEELKKMLTKTMIQKDYPQKEYLKMLSFHRSGLKKDWLDNYEKIAQLRKQLWENLSSLNLLQTTKLLDQSQNWAKDTYMFFAALNFVAAFFYDLKILSLTATTSNTDSANQLLYCEDLREQTQIALKHYDLTKIPDFFDNLVLIGKNLQNFANKNLGWAAVIIGIKRLLV